jgi:hypothetical protein
VRWFFGLIQPILYRKKGSKKFRVGQLLDELCLVVCLLTYWRKRQGLFAHSPCMHKFFPHILHIRQGSLGVYGEGFDEIGKKEGTFPRFLQVRQILYARSPCTSKFLTCILLMPQNSLRAFSIYAKICYANTWKNFANFFAFWPI